MRAERVRRRIVWLVAAAALGAAAIFGASAATADETPGNPGTPGWDESQPDVAPDSASWD